MRKQNIIINHNAQIIYMSINLKKDKLMLAGTPVNAKGEFANDDTAIGILLEDTTPSMKYSEVLIGGYIDAEIAQNASGIEYSQEMMASLKNIVFEGAKDYGLGGGSNVLGPDGKLLNSVLPEGYGQDNSVGIFWDGNTEGLTQVTSGLNFYLYGPFENTIGVTVQSLIGVQLNPPGYNELKITITEEHISDDGKSIYVSDSGGYGIFAFVEEGGALDVYGETLTPGIWLCKYSSNHNQLIISKDIQLFDEKFIGMRIIPFEYIYSIDDLLSAGSGVIYIKNESTLSFNGGTVWLRGLYNLQVYSADEFGLDSIPLGESWYFYLQDSEWICSGSTRLGTTIPEVISAKVGETIVVKAVDDNGMPIKWDAVNPWVIPSSTEGSNKKFRLTVDDSGTLTATQLFE